MQQVKPKILISFSAMAAFLGISARKLFRHRSAMRAAGVIEDRFHQGRLYSVALPAQINRYWRNRSFD